MADGLIRAKRMGRNGKLHFLPGPLAHTALCGVTDQGDGWLPIRSDVGFWSECIKCLSIREKAKADAEALRKAGAVTP